MSSVLSYMRLQDQTSPWDRTQKVTVFQHTSITSFFFFHYLWWKLLSRFIKPIQLCISLINQSWPEMQLEFDIFPYLVHKFIMKNTAALSCSNIVLQKKTVLFKVIHYAWTITRDNMVGQRVEKGTECRQKKKNQYN